MEHGPSEKRGWRVPLGNLVSDRLRLSVARLTMIKRCSPGGETTDIKADVSLTRGFLFAR